MNDVPAKLSKNAGATAVAKAKIVAATRTSKPCRIFGRNVAFIIKPPLLDEVEKKVSQQSRL